MELSKCLRKSPESHRWEKMRKDEKSIFPITLAILEYAQFLDRPNLSFEMEGMWVKLYKLCGGARVPTAKMEAVWLISGCAKNRANFGCWIMLYFLYFKPSDEGDKIPKFRGQMELSGFCLAYLECFRMSSEGSIQLDFFPSLRACCPISIKIPLTFNKHICVIMCSQPPRQRKMVFFQTSATSFHPLKYVPHWKFGYIGRDTRDTPCSPFSDTPKYHITLW